MKHTFRIRNRKTLGSHNSGNILMFSWAVHLSSKVCYGCTLVTEVGGIKENGKYTVCLVKWDRDGNQRGSGWRDGMRMTQTHRWTHAHNKAEALWKKKLRLRPFPSPFPVGSFKMSTLLTQGVLITISPHYKVPFRRIH